MTPRTRKCYALRSGTQALVLFSSKPNAAVIKAIRATKAKVGLAVVGCALPEAAAFDELDYLFVATRSDLESPIKMALRDLKHQHWNPIGVGRAN